MFFVSLFICVCNLYIPCNLSISTSFGQGFGVVAKSTADCRRADPSAVVAFHQADIGEYLRSEDTLT